MGANRPIRYCYQKAADFGAVSDIEGTIQQVFTTWKQYISEKQIYTWSMSPALQFALNAQPMAACDGTEDLKFYLGVENAEVARAKLDFDNPSAFASRTSFDLATGWGKGFVFISSPKPNNPVLKSLDWTFKEAFFGILLHEIGHVLGCDHVNWTVMDQDFSKTLIGLTQNRAQGTDLGDWIRLLTSIDQMRELARCETDGCRSVYSRSFDSQAIQAEDFRSIWQELTGHEPSAPARAGLITNHSTFWALELQDAVGTTSMPINVELAPSTDSIDISDTMGSALFRLATSLPEAASPTTTDLMTATYYNWSSVAYGSVPSKDQQKIPLVIEYNLASSNEPNIAFPGPLAVSYFLNGKKSELFRSEFGSPELRSIDPMSP